MDTNRRKVPFVSIRVHSWFHLLPLLPASHSRFPVSLPRHRRDAATCTVSSGMTHTATAGETPAATKEGQRLGQGV